ncbi:hypothetical protein [Luteibacter sp. OK325]|uniref:hypothetical protein n=1 Tax=Luteibacter sp. OK325 TaxID=2135670 RepID=UPI0011B268D2|nr:hypothetical protein [Luteibacter sp. OK325]
MGPKSTPRPLWTRLRENLTWRPKVHFDQESGVVVVHLGPFRTREVAMERIRRIEAGNRDNTTADTVCVFFHIDGEPVLAVSELDSGFAVLVAVMREYFPGIEKWEEGVPPARFQLASVELWKRPTIDSDPIDDDPIDDDPISPPQA